VVSPDGHALTAAHVVSGSDRVVVTLHSGLELSAPVLRVDESQDVALIRLPGSGHRCLPVNRGGQVDIGTELFAVGAPLSESLAFSVTTRASLVASEISTASGISRRMRASTPAIVEGHW